MLRLARLAGGFAETVMMGFAFAVGWILALAVVSGMMA